MNGRELAAEMAAAASRVRVGNLERLRDLGVSYAALAALNAVEPTIGAARIEAQADSLFQFAEGGTGAVIQAIVTADRELGDAGIIDLIAWKPDHPSRWWWRRGTGFALGSDLLHDDVGVVVVPTPAAWLAHSGQALCILDWSEKSPIWRMLRSGPALAFTDDILRQRARRLLVATAPLPTMELINDRAA